MRSRVKIKFYLSRKKLASKNLLFHANEFHFDFCWEFRFGDVASISRRKHECFADSESRFKAVSFFRCGDFLHTLLCARGKLNFSVINSGLRVSYKAAARVRAGGLVERQKSTFRFRGLRTQIQLLIRFWVALSPAEFFADILPDRLSIKIFVIYFRGREPIDRT